MEERNDLRCKRNSRLMISIIDYGAGNLRSIENALKYLDVEYKITRNAKDLQKSDAIIFPGVGTFKNTMKGIGPIKDALCDEIKSGKPFLGICIGYQVLFTRGIEGGECKGLDILKGEVRKINTEFKLPQIGWNEIKMCKKSSIFNNIPTNPYFYFINSYIPVPEDKNIVAAETTYGETFVSTVSKNNILGVQFHPEKSGESGLILLKNFVELIK